MVGFGEALPSQAYPFSAPVGGYAATGAEKKRSWRAAGPPSHPQGRKHMLDVAFYNLLMEAFDALYSTGSGTPAEPMPAILQLRAGLAESPGWFLIQAA